jgi:hypothetical protein
MTEPTVLQAIAPCGLVCHTCAAAKGGIIHQHSQPLLHYLEGFDVFADKLSAFDPRLKKYAEFREVLELLGEGHCSGCRDGQAKLPGCGIAPCVQDKGVDFCYECSDFPCAKADFEPLLKDKWLKANERMNEIGPEAYLEETKSKSHYA